VSKGLGAVETAILRVVADEWKSAEARRRWGRDLHAMNFTHDATLSRIAAEGVIGTFDPIACGLYCGASRHQDAKLRFGYVA
jgi:hypothetical protein